MKRSLLLTGLAAAALATPAGSQPDWSRAERVTVALSSFRFEPRELHLKAHQPVVLHLQNVGSGGHNFAAPAFFAAAIVRQQDRAKITGGAVDVHGRNAVDVTLVPAAGRYPLRCTHLFHSAFGMTGTIVVS